MKTHPPNPPVMASTKNTYTGPSILDSETMRNFDRAEVTPHVKKKTNFLSIKRHKVDLDF